MIPVLKLNNDAIDKNWPRKEDQDFIKKRCAPVFLEGTEIPVYLSDDNFITLDVYEGVKGRVLHQEFFDYGYCNNDAALAKYLQKYIDDKDEYYVHVNLMSKDYEKYYKNGSFINKDGINTGEDYWDYKERYPDMVGEEEYGNNWIHFVVCKIIRNK